ncbi:TIGR04255 family protein [Cryobacterium sp. TmT2-59]|uniref:TIGR04255 family protein n=1 Tax=Cryobacterium sp. TmT2-59 TaxID=1259264 RepID=UPI001069510A|nr:TIGR04255 family protein [Cryobacterium sp. TmT2-59]TFC87168.1 TIGR04255 family protein [Cryobacterium sp. TmT2-59]
MTDRERYRPFTGDSETRVRLQTAPLELVLFQLRWPELAYLQSENLTPIAQAFGVTLSEYPLYSSTPEMTFSVGPTGVQQHEVGTVHQWSSIDRKRHVSLGKTFLSIYTQDYPGWPDFAEHLRVVLDLLQANVDIRYVERVGVRYLNRIADPELMGRLGELVTPQVLGYQSLPTPASADVVLLQNLNQAQFSVGGGILQVRSGVMAPGTTLDPSVAPVPGPSWILDIDAMIEVNAAFDLEGVLAQAGRMSDAAYDFFKFIIKTGFIDEFGTRTPHADSDPA